MKTLQIILSVALLFTSAGAMAAAPPTQHKEVHPTMQGFAKDLQGLMPYMASRKAFDDKANEKAIAERMKAFRMLSENAKHLDTMKQPDFKPTLRMLQQHLSASERYFQEGHKDLARTMLQSTVQLCISCHARLPSQDSQLYTPDFWKKNNLTPYEKAQYEFATRQFDEAQKSYEAIIKGYPKNKIEVPVLIDSLENTATIYARIQRDPKAAVPTFEKILKRDNLPSFLQSDVEGWLDDFKTWAAEKPFDVATHSDQEVIAEARRILGNHVNKPFSFRNRGSEVDYLRASGLLHEFLSKKPNSPMAADAYYLLGICYLTIDQNFYFGFDTLYFKTCIADYPKAPIAKSCYHLLEESVYLGYSGSGGTNIPFDVMKELNDYKKMIR